MFTTTIILNLLSQRKLCLEDKIDKYLDHQILKGLHTYKAKDYSNVITIKQLLAHTSGLPDYFQGKGRSGKSLEGEIKNGDDQFWTFESAIEMAKQMQPLFIPGAKNKANYADINFQLLGRIIVIITDQTYAANCNQLIIEPLKMSLTYLYQDADDIPISYINELQEWN